MGNWIYTDITIGGTVSAATAKELRELLDAEMDGDGGPEIVGGHLFACGQRNYGNADEVEDFCQEHGLPYVFTWEDGGDFGPGGHAWRPGMEKSFPFDGKDGPGISLVELKRDADAGKTLAEIIEALSIGDASTLPPYVEEAGGDNADAGQVEAAPGSTAPLVEYLCIGTYNDGQRFADSVKAYDATGAEATADEKWPDVAWAGFVALRDGAMTVEG